MKKNKMLWGILALIVLIFVFAKDKVKQIVSSPTVAGGQPTNPGSAVVGLSPIGVGTSIDLSNGSMNLTKLAKITIDQSPIQGPAFNDMPAIGMPAGFFRDANGVYRRINGQKVYVS